MTYKLKKTLYIYIYIYVITLYAPLPLPAATVIAEHLRRSSCAEAQSRLESVNREPRVIKAHFCRGCFDGGGSWLRCYVCARAACDYHVTKRA